MIIHEKTCLFLGLCGTGSVSSTQEAPGPL